MPSRFVEPSPDQLQQLMAGSQAGPIVMLNLLRFKDRADGIHADEGISGREAYEIYGREVGPHIDRVGARVLHLAEGRQTVIGPPEERWDLVILVEYPSRQAFLSMVADAEYQKVHQHREAAVHDSRLICCEIPSG